MTPVIPALRVSSRSILDQWVEAFGFELEFVTGEGDEVGHAELRLGDAWVMAGTAGGKDFDVRPGGASLYLVLADDAAVDALHARAVAAGAGNVREPNVPDYGGRECSLRDADGNYWSFGTYAPGSTA